MIPGRIAPGALLLGVLLLAGCGRGDGTRAAADAPRGTASSTAELDPATGNPNLRPAEGEVRMTSVEGGYAAAFPPGCSRIRTRTYPAGATQGNFTVVQSFADREGHPNEGAMVTVYFDQRGDNGAPPTPRNVTRLIDEMTSRHGLSVVEQRPLARDSWEGVRVFCRETGGSGVMWIQGMLVADRVVIMSAWRPGPDGLADGQIARFFDSFKPATES